MLVYKYLNINFHILSLSPLCRYFSLRHFMWKIDSICYPSQLMMPFYCELKFIASEKSTFFQHFFSLLTVDAILLFNIDWNRERFFSNDDVWICEWIFDVKYLNKKKRGHYWRYFYLVSIIKTLHLKSKWKRIKFATWMTFSMWQVVDAVIWSLFHHLHIHEWINCSKYFSYFIALWNSFHLFLPFLIIKQVNLKSFLIELTVIAPLRSTCTQNRIKSTSFSHLEWINKHSRQRKRERGKISLFII